MSFPFMSVTWMPLSHLPGGMNVQRTGEVSLRSASKWGTGALELTLFATDNHMPKMVTLQHDD